MKPLIFLLSILISGAALAQTETNSTFTEKDSLKQHSLQEIIITASRIPESILRSPVSIQQLSIREAKLMGAVTAFDAIENTKAVHVITPSLGFRVLNSRGFSNTTNVRFAQLIDGIDNQAPHIGAPIANAFGACDLDIDKIEIMHGTASALYGLNATNGLVNILTKDPFQSQGITIQQLAGVNHNDNINNVSPQLFSTTNLRYAKAINSRIALKVNGTYTDGSDWIADNMNDLAADINASTGLTGIHNPASDEVNTYGDESPNRRTLTLNGKKYVIARTGYKESEVADYHIQNYKGDIGLYYRFKENKRFSVTYKGALINNIYQRSNRFRLEDYKLNQYALDYHSPIGQLRSYLTRENTGKSYNLRSLAENMDRTYKSDNQWFADYTAVFNSTLADGASVQEAHTAAREITDLGRFQPGTVSFDQKKAELISINNWDQGAALRVRSSLFHSEGSINWDKVFPAFFNRSQSALLSGFDHRTYFIIPDGNYFINPVDTSESLTYGKSGAFVQINKGLMRDKIRVGLTMRADKADHFEWKFNPRVVLVYSPAEEINFRITYQSGYRFPSIFEGFSNVNSGGVKRVGGLRIMSDGIFENSYTKASIDAFQAKVINDINTLGHTQSQAIANNKGMLKKNPYTYLQPEFIRSGEIGFRGLAIKKRLFFDADLYYSSYDNFIAQVEASIPNTSNGDSVATYLFSKSKQSRYRLWTTSTSNIYSYGSSLALKYRYNEKLSVSSNVTYSKLDRTDDKDGLEDGFNTPLFSMNTTINADRFWKRLGGGITARYQTKYDYVSFLVSGEVPAYWSADAQVNYQFENNGLTIKVGATNLLNKRYYTILGGPSIGGLYYLSMTWELKRI